MEQMVFKLIIMIDHNSHITPSKQWTVNEYELKVSVRVIHT